MSVVLNHIVRLTCRRPLAIDKIEERLGLSRREVMSEIREARRAGAIIEVVDGFVGTKVRVAPGDVVEIGAAKAGRHHVAHVTDVHFGSRMCADDALLSFLHKAWDLGCRTAACTGDVLDGLKDVLILEQRAVGFDAQSDEAVRTLKQAPPFEWAVIDGNHDGYYSNLIGFKSGELLAHRMREAGIKWHFAGVCLGRARIHGARWYLWHPHGAASTRNALRRKLNAKAETLNEPVDVLAMGHFHHFATIPIVKERVFGIAGGTFQRMGTEFANRIENPWDIGAAIVSYDLDRQGRVMHTAAEFYAAD